MRRAKEWHKPCVQHEWVEEAQERERQRKKECECECKTVVGKIAGGSRLLLPLQMVGDAPSTFGFPHCLFMCI